MAVEEPSRVNRSLGRRLAWHRILGIAIAVPIALLAITGVLLNHVDLLGLDRRLVADSRIMAWYGLLPKEEPVGYPTVHGWVARVGDVLLIDGKQVSEGVAPLVGAVASADGIVVATAQELFIHTADGHLVERLHSTGLPGHLDAVGVTSAGSTAVRSAHGVYAADRDLLTWRLTEEPTDWARSGPLPASERDRVLRAYHGGGLPWSRILLDVHTGRIFGSWGSIVMDVVAVALLVLAGTGLLNWRAHRRRMRRARAVNWTTASAPETWASGNERRPLSTGLNTEKPPAP